MGAAAGDVKNKARLSLNFVWAVTLAAHGNSYDTFFQILHCGSNEKLTRKNPTSQKERADKLGKIFLPIFQVLFVTVYSFAATVLYFYE